MRPSNEQSLCPARVSGDLSGPSARVTRQDLLPLRLCFVLAAPHPHWPRTSPPTPSPWRGQHKRQQGQTSGGVPRVGTSIWGQRSYDVSASSLTSASPTTLQMVLHKAYDVRAFSQEECLPIPCSSRNCWEWQHGNHTVVVVRAPCNHKKQPPTEVALRESEPAGQGKRSEILSRDPLQTEPFLFFHPLHVVAGTPNKPAVCLSGRGIAQTAQTAWTMPRHRRQSRSRVLAGVQLFRAVFGCLWLAQKAEDRNGSGQPTT